MALTLHLAAFVGFAVSGFARDTDHTVASVRAPTVPRAFLRSHPPVATCRWQRDSATGRLSARWQT